MSKEISVIVIGAGLGGLVAACTMAKAGAAVTLLEASDQPGGYCREIRKDGLAWNLSLYSIRGCRPGGPFTKILDELGLSDRVAFHHSAESYRVRFEGHEFPLTARIDVMLDAAERIEAGGADRLRPLIDALLEFNPVRDYADLSRKTFAEAAGALGVSGKLLAVFSAPLFISLGVPPSRASAYFTYLKYQLLLQEGVSYPVGGPERFIGAFVDAFQSAGGTLRLSQRVHSILPEPGGRITTETEDGTLYRSGYAIINADLTWALSTISDSLPARVDQKTKELQPGLSAHLLFMAVNRELLTRSGLNAAPQVVHLEDPDIDGLHARLLSGQPQASTGCFGVSSPAYWEPDRPADRYPVTAFFPSRYPSPSFDDRELIEAWTAESSPAVELFSALHPDDLHRLTGNRGGSFSGWESGIERYGRSRIQQKLPVTGIYAAGHWTDPGPSLLNVALSGKKAAESVLAQMRKGDR